MRTTPTIQVVETKLNWRKVASVSRGGKPFFYFALDDSVSYSVCWNRFEKRYSLTINHEHVSFHDSFNDGMKTAQDIANDK
jgi:hypothetical protein